MYRIPRLKNHDLGNNIGENPKKSCNCPDCKEINKRAKKIFNPFKFFSRNKISKREKQYLLQEFKAL